MLKVSIQTAQFMCCVQATHRLKYKIRKKAHMAGKLADSQFGMRNLLQANAQSIQTKNALLQGHSKKITGITE
jgi:hypothetical protein